MTLIRLMWCKRSLVPRSPDLWLAAVWAAGILNSNEEPLWKSPSGHSLVIYWSFIGDLLFIYWLDIVVSSCWRCFFVRKASEEMIWVSFCSTNLHTGDHGPQRMNSDLSSKVFPLLAALCDSKAESWHHFKVISHSFVPTTAASNKVAINIRFDHVLQYFFIK